MWRSAKSLWSTTRICQGVAARYAAMNELRLKYPLRMVIGSGYYSQARRKCMEIRAAHAMARNGYSLAEHEGWVFAGDTL